MSVRRLDGYCRRVSEPASSISAEAVTPIEIGPAPAVPPGRRVLTISADMGGGHNATAAALEEAVERLWPGSEVRRLDTLDLLGPGVGSLFRKVYVANVETTPWLYEFFYSSLWRHHWFSAASKRFTGSWCGRRLAAEIDSFDPDVILSTYPLGSAGLAWLHKHRGLDVATGAWVSDFAPHPFWVYRELDANFVMHEVAAPNAWAAAAGAEVQVCAPPVLSRFTPGNQAAAREEMGLAPDRFVVLVSCGAYAFGDVAGTVRTLLDASPLVQVVAVCGRDEVTRRRLEQCDVPKQRLMPLGWTDRMPMLLRAADIVVTNAGGATSLEALASGTPVVMFQPIAAHGDANADLMVVSGLADLCTTCEQLRSYVQSAVIDRLPMQEMARRETDFVIGHDLDKGLLSLGPTAHRALRTATWPARPGDAFFAHVETADLRQELGAVLELGPIRGGSGSAARSVSLAEVRERMAACTPHLPPLRRLLVRRPRPGWVLQEAVDVDCHVDEHVVPADADRAAMMAVVGEFWSQSMPAGQPGWQMLLVHGRADGRSLLAIKLHHCHGDGISALGLLDRLLTPAPGDKLLQRRALSSPAGRELHPRRILAAGATAVRTTTTGLWSLATRARPGRFPLNARQPGSERQIVGVPLPWQTFRGVARALHAKPHELAVAVVTDALGRVLRPTGLVPEKGSLRVMVPVAMRPARLDRISGNWTGTIALDVPLEPMSPERLVRQVRAELDHRLRRGEPQAAQAVMRLAGRLPMNAHRLFARAVYNRRFFHTIVSFMPGARDPRWCAGARVLAAYPLLPLTSGVPLTVGILVADETAGVGVLADPSLGLDSHRLAAAVSAAFEAAVAAAEVATRSSAAESGKRD